MNKALQLFQVSEDEVDKKQKMVNELRNVSSAWLVKISEINLRFELIIFIRSKVKFVKKDQDTYQQSRKVKKIMVIAFVEQFFKN